MPNYGKIHYSNDVKGITKGKPTHVVDRSKSYGDYTKDSNLVMGSHAMSSKLNEFDKKYWEVPKPSKIKYV